MIHTSDCTVGKVFENGLLLDISGCCFRNISSLLAPNLTAHVKKQKQSERLEYLHSVRVFYASPTYS